MLITAHMVFSVQRPPSCASVSSDVKARFLGGLRESIEIKSWWACTLISSSAHRHQPSLLPSIVLGDSSDESDPEARYTECGQGLYDTKKPRGHGGSGGDLRPRPRDEAEVGQWLAPCQWKLLGFSIARGKPSENVHSSFQKLFLGRARATEKGCMDMLEDSWGLAGLETDHEGTAWPVLE